MHVYTEEKKSLASMKVPVQGRNLSRWVGAKWLLSYPYVLRDITFRMS